MMPQPLQCPQRSPRAGDPASCFTHDVASLTASVDNVTVEPHSARRLRLAATGLLASLLAFMLCSPIAHAQGNKKAAAEIPVKAVPAKVDPGKDAPAADANDADGQLAKVKIERGAGGRKIYKIEGEIVIEGKIQKPEAFYVLQKSGINYDWHELKQDFVPKILDSVTKAPF